MLRYQYALANVWWNISGQDQPLFATPEAMQSYFDSVATPWGDLSNFSIGDSINTSIFIRVSTLPTNEVLDKHYVIVREMDGDTVTKQYHYFAQLSQDSGSQYFAELTRDVIIDYYNFGEVRQRPYTYIMRTHLDRFVNEDGTLKVNGSNDSPLYIAEDLNTDTPLCVVNDKVNFVDASPNRNGGTTAPDTMWCYIYLKKNTVIEVPEYYEENIPMGYSVIVLPVGYFYLQHSNGTREPWNATYFLIVISQYFPKIIPYIFNIRISLTPPNRGIWQGFNGRFDFNADVITQYNVGVLWEEGDDLGIVYLSGRGLAAMTDDVTATLTDAIPSIKNLLGEIDSNFIKSPKNYKKEVKLYNGIITAYIASGTNKGIGYNLLSLLYNTDNPFTFELYESLVAGITRYYYGISCATSFYNKNNIKSYSQNPNSVDTTIPYSENQLDTFLANNKNFYQQTDLEYNYRMGREIAKATGNALGSMGKGPKEFFGNLFEQTVNVGTAVSDRIYAQMQRDYQIDNLRNAPPNLHNIDGNYMLIQSLTTLCPRLEVWQPSQSNLEKIADKLFFYGYNYQKIGTLSQVDSTRKYFNYIECDIAGVNYNMNDKAFALLREKLIAGVRLWHTKPTDVNFNDTDNYEVWIDELDATGV